MRIGKLVVLSALVAALAHSQASAQADAAQSPRVLRNVISANPFLLIATWFNAEYERLISTGSTVGVRVSTLGLDEGPNGDDDVNYYSGRAFWRYYPSGAYTGFFFGLGLGVTSLGDRQFA